MDALTLFQKYVTNIKPYGTNQYIGNCPYPEHEDNKPSFTFSSEGLYSCKGCPVKGNAVTFAKDFNEDP